MERASLCATASVTIDPVAAEITIANSSPSAAQGQTRRRVLFCGNPVGNGTAVGGGVAPGLGVGAGGGGSVTDGDPVLDQGDELMRRSPVVTS